MNMLKKWVSLALLACLAVSCLAGCGPTPDESSAGETEFVDYASQLKLDMNSETKKLEVTVKSYIDGDTVHFYTSDSYFAGGVIKARFLAIDTPESTGRIEEYGKKASTFTKETLQKATSIIVESDDEKWNPDSTGSRFMLWIWYKTAQDADYHLLNLEILQNGLAVASNTANNRYGETCMAALAQAKAQKLNVFSGEKDPDYYYGEAVELTIKELRANLEAYNGISVAFHGVITMNDSNTLYVEQYDEETDMYYGMAVYLGYNLPGTALDILSVGNESRIVGKVQYYETGDSWQVSGLTYSAMKPDSPTNVKLISQGNSPAYKLIDAETFVNGTVEVEVGEEVQAFPYAMMALNSSVAMENLTVVSVYTTTNEESSSQGAMTLTCTVDGLTVSVRTAVLYDANGDLVTADAYMGKNISVKGAVDYYDGTYQIKVLTVDNITVNE